MADDGLTAIQVIALGIGIGMVLAGLGAGVGLAYGLITNAAYLSALSPAAATVTGFGFGLGGVGAGGYVVFTVVRRVIERPERWGPPALAAVSAVVVDLCKEFYPDVSVGRLLLGGATLILFVPATLFWNAAGYLGKTVSCILFGMPPTLVLVGVLDKPSHKAGFLEALYSVSYVTWVLLCILCILSVASIFTLAWKARASTHI